jgi:hypothetical protein
MASIRDTLAGLFAKESPSAIQGTPLGNAYPSLAQPEPGLEAPFLSPDDLIGTGIGKAALVGAGKAMPLIAGTFIGPKSKLWNTEAHSLAKALEAKGANPEEIWKQTGNVKAPDNMWRQEISDVNATTTFPKRNTMGTVMPMEKRLSHEELYQAYPDLRKMDLELTSDRTGNAGAFNGTGVELSINEVNKPSTKPIMLHELQHAIQNKEGFGRGGNPASASFEDVLPQIQNIKKQRQELNIDPYQIQNNIASGYHVPQETLNKYNTWNNLMEQENNLLNNRMKPYDVYKRLLGEAESRLTEHRIPLTQEQRLQHFPFKEGEFGLDVPYKELIVKQLLNK